VRKLASLLGELKIQIIGVIENMKMEKSDVIRKQTEKLGLKFLEEIPYDPKLEEAIGSPDRLLRTTFGKKIEEVSSAM
jgi:Mrp family chromosome partitioning ATPase